MKDEKTLKTTIEKSQYILQIIKSEKNGYGVIILKKYKNRVTPVLDFRANLIQEDPDIGIELEFNIEDIYLNYVDIFNEINIR